MLQAVYNSDCHAGMGVDNSTLQFNTFHTEYPV